MNPFTDTLHIVRGVSVLHRRFLFLLCGMASLVLLGLCLARPWLLFGVPLLIGYLVMADRRARLCPGQSILRLRWHRDGRWQWQTRADREVDRWQEGTLADARLVGASLVILHLRPAGRWWMRRRCLLFADAVDGPTHRRLRARLTISDPTAAPPLSADS